MRKRTRTAITKAVISAAFILAVILGISQAGDYWGSTCSDENLQRTEDTVRQYAVQCYALEGKYPESLEYLEENYMLTLNEDEYVYHYNFIGTNMMPDISVFPAL